MFCLPMMERWLGGKLKRRWIVIVPLTRSAGTDDYLSIKFIKLIPSGVGAWWIVGEQFSEFGVCFTVPPLVNVTSCICSSSSLFPCTCGKCYPIRSSNTFFEHRYITVYILVFLNMVSRSQLQEESLLKTKAIRLRTQEISASSPISMQYAF